MTTFKIGFDGPSVENGEIDVNDLAPSLLALGELFTAANAALNQTRAKSKLNIKATEKGSFVALLSLDVSFVTDLLDVVSANPDRLTAAKDLLDVLLKTGAAIGGPITFFAALRHLGGQRADASEKNDDGTTSITMNGTTIIVDRRTAVLLEDGPTREATKKFVKTSLAPDGVRSVGFVHDDADLKGDRSLVLTRDDIAAVSIPEPSEDEKETITQTRVALLKIVSAQFQEGYLWRFTDGQNTFTASMEDRTFLNQIDSADVQLTKNDTLRCLIEETQELSGNQLKTTARILEVKGYIPGARQLRLL